MKKLLYVLAATASALLLAACSAPGDSAAETKEMIRETAAEYERLAYQGAQYQLSMLQNPVDFNVASVQTTSGSEVPRPLTALMTHSGVSPQQSDGCVTESGNPADSDNDPIPVNATYTYDCSESDPQSGYSFTLSGTVTVSVSYACDSATATYNGSQLAAY